MSATARLSEQPLEGCKSMGLEKARLYLATRARVRTPLGAAELLGRTADHGRETYDKRVQVAVEVLSIYREIFPEEWRRSGSPAFSTQREHEFYRLVHAKLFPLLLSEDTDLETHMRREPNFFLPFIPMRGTQRHTWADGRFDFREIEIEFKLAQVLSGYTGAGGPGWQALRLMYGIEGVEAPAPPLGSVGWQLFTYSCAVEETPLKYLPLAFNMISYRTGNPWLDLPQIGYAGFDWSREEVARLAFARHQADDLNLTCKALGVWLEEAPAGRIARAVELWNRAALTEKEYGYEGMSGADLIREGRALPTGLFQHGEEMVRLTLPREIFQDVLGEAAAPLLGREEE
ncbi:MAG TPA: hypothetical protein VF723_11430 [Pyrinomonadaceae bacterium]|jgi:hypothetical protein